MRLKNAWHKNNIREIRHTFERFIAIIAIITLGVGFFSGLIITKGAMVQTLDSYIDKYNMYDYRLISSLGLTEDDVKHFSNLEDVFYAEGAISIDFIGELELEKEINLKAHSLTNTVNKLNIIEGKMPKSADECLGDAKYFSKEDIGAKISVSPSNDDSTIEKFAHKNYTIVGIADSVNYISYERGTTKIGNGSIDAFIYIPKDGFSLDIYTEIYLKLDSNSKIYSNEYKDFISSKEGHIKDELTQRTDIRYQEIKKEAEDKIVEAQKEYDTAFNEFQQEKTKAINELEDAFNQLEEAREEIEKNEAQLAKAEKELSTATKEYEESFRDFEKSLSDFETKKATTLASFEEKQEEISKNRKSILSAIEQIENSGMLELEDSQDVRMQYEELKSSLLELDNAQKQLTLAKQEAELEFYIAESEFKNAKSKLDSAKAEIDKSRKELTNAKIALNEGKAEYEKGLVEYNKAKKEADIEFAKAEEELADAISKIEDAKDEIKDMPKAELYVFDRTSNTGYASFENDSAIVEGIAKFLPVFFFLVAALVCSTTMSRMVDEQRLQIGTLKALGYSNGAITRKYMFYSGSASVIGCILGYILGTKYFPVAIWTAYDMLYDFAPIEYIFDLKLAAISLLVSLLCSAGVTFISCKNELSQMPAELIRPKAPKSGKRVFLEKLPFIWTKVKFLHKVAIRNIFRYKKRLLMTILGVAGCTGLILAALGIKDSISNIADDQFDNIMKYDFEVYFSKPQRDEDIAAFKKEFSKDLSECVFASNETIEVIANNVTKKASLIATDDSDITKLIGFSSNSEHVPYPLFGKTIINDKLANLYDLSIGDTITIKLGDTEFVDFEVSGIFDNYVNNYLFITSETYDALLGKAPKYQTAYALAQAQDSIDLNSISAKISNFEDVAYVSVVDNIRTSVANMMQSLNYIVWLVIACACALAFVVLYNLNNINITERTREIATIKVLGFYSKETYSYVFRESFVLTLIGTLIGLGLGKIFHSFIMSQISVDIVSFKEQIFITSYVTASLITLMLTIVVNMVLRRKINNINMAESLKSVE